LVSRSIGETLADDAFHSVLSASFVVNASCDPIIVPEIELGKIPMEMALVALC
jgi:hypothetical protein